MAKAIKISKELLEGIRKEFEEALGKAKLSNGKFTFTRDIGKIEGKRATLYYKENAWLKQQALVDNFDKEVAWHGIAKRDEEEENAYIIEDILVYPQTVTGATVNTDQDEYQTWLYSQSDEVFNHIRMQGHSHVNMGVTPSSVDEELYNALLAQLTGDMFYIFLIFNKRGDRTIKIYDMKENIFFENSDVDLMIIEDGPKIESFVEQAKTLVKARTYQSTTNTAVNSVKSNNTSSKAETSSSKKKGKLKKSQSSYGGYNTGYSGGYYGRYGGYDYDDDFYGVFSSNSRK